MKKTLFVLFLLSASAMFGQSAGANVLSNEAIVVHPPSHPAEATQRPMAEERNLLFSSNDTSARGERPLWEFARPAAEVPLGDIARALRQEHVSVRKAVKTLEQ